MANNIDIKDIMLEATAEIQEIVREVLQELAEPQTKEYIRQAWANAPDEMKEQYMRDDPEGYRSLMDALNERS